MDLKTGDIVRINDSSGIYHYRITISKGLVWFEWLGRNGEMNQEIMNSYNASRVEWVAHIDDADEAHVFVKVMDQLWK